MRAIALIFLLSLFSGKASAAAEKIDLLVNVFAAEGKKSPAAKEFRKLVEDGLRFESDLKELRPFTRGAAPLLKKLEVSAAFGTLYVGHSGVKLLALRFGEKANVLLVNGKPLEFDLSRPLLNQGGKPAGAAATTLLEALIPAAHAEDGLGKEMQMELQRLFGAFVAAQVAYYRPSRTPLLVGIAKEHYRWWDSGPDDAPCSVDGENRHSFDLELKVGDETVTVPVTMSGTKQDSGGESIVVRGSAELSSTLASFSVNLLRHGDGMRRPSFPSEGNYYEDYEKFIDSCVALSEKQMKFRDCTKSCSKELEPKYYDGGNCRELIDGCKKKICFDLEPIPANFAISNDLKNKIASRNAELEKRRKEALAPLVKVLAAHKNVKADPLAANFDLNVFLKEYPDWFSGTEVKAMTSAWRKSREHAAVISEANIKEQAEKAIGDRALQLLAFRACCGSSRCKQEVLDVMKLNFIPQKVPPGKAAPGK